MRTAKVNSSYCYYSYFFQLLLLTSSSTTMLATPCYGWVSRTTNQRLALTRPASSWRRLHQSRPSSLTQLLSIRNNGRNSSSNSNSDSDSNNNNNNISNKSDDSKAAGTFFHRVPPSNVDAETPRQSPSRRKRNGQEQGGMHPAPPSFEVSMAELLRQQRKAGAPSPAGEPFTTQNGVVHISTLNGGNSARGNFATSSSASNSSSSYYRNNQSRASNKPYVGIGPTSLNDIRSPQIDDQGYTLYANGKTGETTRVFEALVQYPCIFTLKIVGANDGSFVPEMVALVAETCRVGVADVEHSTRNVGKWISVTVQAPVQCAQMLYALYEVIDQDPRVKFKF